MENGSTNEQRGSKERAPQGFPWRYTVAAIALVLLMAGLLWPRLNEQREKLLAVERCLGKGKLLADQGQAELASRYCF